jgi:long-chain acyl-CoA synthetase
MSENRPEWWIADLASLSLGAVSAAIYPTSAPRDVGYILRDCGARVVLVSSAAHLETVRRLRAEGATPALEHVVVFDPVPTDDAVQTLAAVSARGAGAPDPLCTRLPAISPTGLATLTYTSGTTGEPKGVMLSHENILSNVRGAKPIIDGLELADRLMLSFLPLSHSFERTLGYYAAIALDFRVAFNDDLARLSEDLIAVRPTLLVSVPRIYEKVYARVLAAASTPLKRRLLSWALAVGKERARRLRAGRDLPLGLRWRDALATRLIFSKMRARLGGRLRYAISGSAPLAVEVAEFLAAIGLEVFEGYGLSETSPVLTANRPGKVRFGSVGVPWPEVEIRIEPEPTGGDGEILARGPNVMLGYYGKREATAEVLSPDGWFRTGDIGHFDADGFLFITDRKKELLKTSGGKYVAPQPIENALRASPLVEQAVLLGDRRKYCALLIVPNSELLAQRLGRAVPAEVAALNADTEIGALFQALVDGVNAERGSWEQVKRFALLAEPLSLERGELTPTLKVKRRVVEQRYAELIETLYTDARERGTTGA